MRLDERELGTVLAALRWWQGTANPTEAQEIATDNGRLEELTPEEIDDLCDRINTTGETDIDDV